MNKKVLSASIAVIILTAVIAGTVYFLPAGKSGQGLYLSDLKRLTNYRVAPTISKCDPRMNKTKVSIYDTKPYLAEAQLTKQLIGENDGFSLKYPGAWIADAQFDYWIHTESQNEWLQIYPSGVGSGGGPAPQWSKAKTVTIGGKKALWVSENDGCNDYGNIKFTDIPAGWGTEDYAWHISYYSSKENMPLVKAMIYSIKFTK